MAKDTATVEAPTSPQATALPALTLEDIAGLLNRAVNDALEPLSDRLAALERTAGQPRFVKAKPAQQPHERTYLPSEELQQRARRGLPKGGADSGTARWLDTKEGRAGLPPAFRPIFGPGDRVQINRDSPIISGPIMPTDKSGNILFVAETWGQFLDQANIKGDGVGEVTGTMYHTETWEPKYKVDMPGGLPSAYRESELLPA